MSGILSIEDLHTHYICPRGTVKAVDGCSVDILKGETLGVAGESGCGKTTFARSILRLIHPPHKIVGGSIYYKETDILGLTEKELRDVRWNDISLVLQQSMNALNPMLKISNQMIEPLLRMGENKQNAKAKAEKLLEQVGLDSGRIDNYPHEFSGGMKQRVLIALSLMCNPSVVILDEPTTALDVVVQHMLLRLIDNLKKEMNLSVIWITHDLAVLAEICDRIAIMYAGRIVETGTTEEVILHSKHPYTKGLLQSFPTLDQLDKELEPIRGQPPDLISPPKGCRFSPRCPFKTDICEKAQPKRERIPSRERGYIECHNWQVI